MTVSALKYEEIMRGYNDRRLLNTRLMNERRQEVYSSIPEYREIEDAISELSVKRARFLIFGSSSDSEASVSEQISQLRTKKAQLLEAAGFSSDYMEMVYDCADCQDTGFIGNDRCHCLTRRIIDALYEQSHIKSVLEKENFTFFTYKYYNETEKMQMEKIVAAAHAFVDNFDTTFSNLLFFGNVGCGKTFLTNCIAKELLDSGHSVIYLTAHQIFEMLAKITFDKESDESDISFSYDDIYECDLLVIDDLGSELTNSFVISRFFTILNERLQREHSTIISTNLEPQKLVDTYTERSVSRILGSYNLYPFTGRDIRQLKRTI